MEKNQNNEWEVQIGNEDELSQTTIFKLRIGMQINFSGSVYRVVSAKPNGNKATLKFIGLAVGGQDGLDKL